MTLIGHVKSLWRYPVKSMGGESIALATFNQRGLESDRMLAVRNPAGKFGSGKSTNRFRHIPGLLNFRSWIEGGQTFIAYLDEWQMAAGDPAMDAALEAILGQPVSLAREADIPHFDDGAVHLISAQTLETAGRYIDGTPLDERRLRPNLVVDLAPGLVVQEPATESGPIPLFETGAIGKTVAIGSDLRLHFTTTTERCVMTSQAQPGLAADPRVTRLIAQRTHSHLGLYAEVLRPGTIAIGDPVTLLP